MSQRKVTVSVYPIFTANKRASVHDSSAPWIAPHQLLLMLQLEFSTLGSSHCSLCDARFYEPFFSLCCSHGLLHDYIPLTQVL